MATTNEHILLVESNPEIVDLISRQTLQPIGFQVEVVSDASKAIEQVIKFTPDLIISNLNLPGLSGKDLMVALSSQGLHIPLIVIAENGQEDDVIQAFRLGAKDYLLWPARDAEVVSVVEHSLRQVRDQHARQDLDLKQNETIQGLERRIRELSIMIAIGKEILSTRDQAVLVDKLVESAIYLATANCGWLMMEKETPGSFELAASRNLPEGWSANLGKAFNDEINAIITSPGKTSSLNENSLKQLNIESLGQSAIAVPINVDQKAIGLLVVIRDKKIPIEKDRLALLNVLADYAVISLSTSHLFRELQETALSKKDDKDQNVDLNSKLKMEIRDCLNPIAFPLEQLISHQLGPLTGEQQQALSSSWEVLQSVLKLVETGKNESTHEWG